ncbi:CoA ester lyase [Desulfurobacterium sp.]|uniref:HpcH/HpaI aldolase/citrate lyase family protein n=1 Tax=Desulfurobacterium sp. TaxID=2004706 RepID=UPI00261B1136|nr:CoA ester lyase [Desulfurobacterium sp.]
MDIEKFFETAEKVVETGNIEELKPFENPVKYREPVRKRFIRSAILVSGDRVKHLRKIFDRDVDIIIFNLEDGVADSKKQVARKIIKTLLSLRNSQDKELVVRINSIDSPFFYDDITEILPSLPHALRLSKVESENDVIALDAIISGFEKSRELPERTIKIHLSIETGKGIKNLEKILTASERVETAYLGILDLFSDLNLPQNLIEKSPTTTYIKTRFVTACRTFNVNPVAPAYQNYKDLKGFEKECKEDRMIGFNGKSCISVKQTEIANSIFLPDREEIEKAQMIVKLYEKALKEGKGGITCGDLFIDQPIYKDALNLLKNLHKE